MKIIAHRGFWQHTEEKNSLLAFQRCVKQGFGIETDIRDLNGELVVCHDIPLPGQSLLSFDSFLELYRNNIDEDAVLAINIKSDGLHELIRAAIDKHGIRSYFTFDMSFPTLFFNYRKNGLRFFTSVNEYMQRPALIDEALGVWLDAYTDIWYSADDIARYLSVGKEVCIVSPELHARPHNELWEMLKDGGLSKLDTLSLCTDFPMQAKQYF